MCVILVTLSNGLLTLQSLVVLIFFVPYVLFQLPSSIIVRKLGPKAFLGGITFLWGIVMMVSLMISSSTRIQLIPWQCFGFIHDWRVMLGLRVILGTFEAGLFPGAVYLLSLWYTRCMPFYHHSVVMY